MLRRRRSRHTRSIISKMPAQTPLAAHGSFRAVTIRSASGQTNKRSGRVKFTSAHLRLWSGSHVVCLCKSSGVFVCKALQRHTDSSARIDRFNSGTYACRSVASTTVMLDISRIHVATMQCVPVTGATCSPLAKSPSNMIHIGGL